MGPESDRCSVPEGDEEGDGRDAIGELEKLSSLPAGLRIRAAAQPVSDSMGSNGKLPVLERLPQLPHHRPPKLGPSDFTR